MAYKYKIHSQSICEGRYEIFYGVWDQVYDYFCLGKGG